MIAPRRIRLSRARGWRKPEGAVVVARPSIWGNPWLVGVPARLALRMYGGWQYAAFNRFGEGRTALAAVERFRFWLEDGWVIDDLRNVYGMSEAGAASARIGMRTHREMLVSRLPELRGRDLGCWCGLDQPCHVDVLLEAANR